MRQEHGQPSVWPEWTHFSVVPTVSCVLLIQEHISETVTDARWQLPFV